MLAFTLHDSFGEVHILFFDLKISEVGCDVFALGRRSFSWRLTGEEMMIASGHDPLNGLSMLSGPHFVLEAIHCDLGAEELSILCNKIKKKVYLT